jgi:hypothetical protein
MLNHPCIPGMKPTWSWWMIFLMCCWVWFAIILLRIFASPFSPFKIIFIRAHYLIFIPMKLNFSYPQIQKSTTSFDNKVSITQKNGYIKSKNSK